MREGEKICKYRYSKISKKEKIPTSNKLTGFNYFVPWIVIITVRK